MLRTPWVAAFSAATTIARASSTVFASGFSHSTCLPASSAAIAISACVSPGVHTSTRSTSSRAPSALQSVSTEAQPSRSAAAPAASALRPPRAAMSTWYGRSKKRPAVRHAWECAAPMNAYPIIPTPSLGLSVLIPLLSPRSPTSGLEAQRDVLVDVALGHGRAGQRDGRRYLVLDQVPHALALGDEPRQVDRGRRHARRVGHRRLEDGVVGLDGVHGVPRAGAADHEELLAARLVYRREDAHALVVVVVPDGVDLRRRLQEVR